MIAFIKMCFQPNVIKCMYSHPQCLDIHKHLRFDRKDRLWWGWLYEHQQVQGQESSLRWQTGRLAGHWLCAGERNQTISHNLARRRTKLEGMKIFIENYRTWWYGWFIWPFEKNVKFITFWRRMWCSHYAAASEEERRYFNVWLVLTNNVMSNVWLVLRKNEMSKVRLILNYTALFAMLLVLKRKVAFSIVV